MSRIPRRDDCLLTVPEAAEFLHLSPGTLYHLVSEKRVPVIRISSRCIRFSLTTLRLWLEDLTETAVQPGPSISFAPSTRRHRVTKNRNLSIRRLENESHN